MSLTTPYAGRMRFGVLGAVTAWHPDGAPAVVGGPRSRTLLALLALDAGRFVPAERLIDGMYGEHPPDGAANALQSQVSRLRTALKDLAPVEFTAAGYRLVVDPDEVDVHRFERLAREGRGLLKAGSPAADVLGEALALWRGPAFSDLADAPFAAAQAARLHELRADAADDHVEARLALGQAEDVLAGLRETIAARPLRERPRTQLVRALHAAGRSADALAAFEDARRTLADELGADPGAELAEAHLAVLRGETEKPAISALPAQLTSFVGRDDELRQVSELLARARLVTLTGPGGTGKTRLAVEVAAAEAGPVAFVELAPHGPADVVGAALTALGLRDTPLRQREAQDPADRLIAALRDRTTLLVLDNCEHVIDVAARLAGRLLGACPGLRVLATSREPLGITGEQLAPVPRLAVPPPGTSAARAGEFAAIRLFADRAAASDPAFAVDESTIGDVQHICAALDGLPLALELAAARVRILPAGEIAARLDDRFRLLARGSRTAEARHRSLRGVVEWSWDLLDDEERELARRLTVFPGGATSAAAAEVCGADVDLLPELADKSLVEAVGGRFRMLETIRAFCAEKLAEAGETDALHRAHAEYFLRFAEEADPMLRTAAQLEWLARIDADYDNILAALRWAADADIVLALRLVTPLAMYWWMRGRRFEGAGVSLEVVKRCGPEVRAEYLEEFLLCMLTALAGMPNEEALAPYVPLAQRYARDSMWMPRHPMLIMVLAVVVGPPADDAELYGRGEAMLAQGDAWSWALVPTGLGLRSMMTGDLGQAEEGLREGAAQYRALGERWGLSMALDHLSQLLSWRGEHAEALVKMDESLALMHELGATDDVADLITRRAWTRVLQGDHDGARADYELAASTARRSGMPESRAAAYVGLADLSRLAGDLATARAFCERALAECEGGSFAAETAHARALISLGWLALAEGRVSDAAGSHRQALLVGRHWHAGDVVAFALEGLAGAAAHPEQAAVLLGAAAAVRGTAISGDPDASSIRARVRESLGAAGFERAYGVGLGMSAQKALTTAGLAD